MIRANKKYSMKMKDAGATLQNVFDAVGVQHNTIPFDKIMLRSRAETRTVSGFQYLAMTFLLIVLLSPLLFDRDANFKIKGSAFGQHVIIVDHQLYDDCFSMKMMGSKIDYANINSVRENGSIIFPKTIDVENGIVVFPYDGSSLSINIPTQDGQVLHAVLAERK